MYAFILKNRGVIHADGYPGSPGEDAPNEWPGCGAEYWYYDGPLTDYDIAGGGGGGGGGGCGGDGGTVEIHTAYMDELGVIQAEGGPGGARGLGGISGTTRAGHPLIHGCTLLFCNQQPGCPGGSLCTPGGDGGNAACGDNGVWLAEDGEDGSPGLQGDDGTVLIYQDHVLAPEDDAYIAQPNPESNYGAAPELLVQSADGPGGVDDWRIHSLIKPYLPVSGVEDMLIQATLYLYYYAYSYNNPAGRLLTCRAIREDWEEETVTWQDRPEVLTFPTSGATVPASYGWMSWDVTADIRAMYQGEDRYGWQISDEEYWGQADIPVTKFYSKEALNCQFPYLEILYAPCECPHCNPDCWQEWFSAAPEDPQRATELRLAAIQPNPSTGVSRVRYYVPAGGLVRLDVLDIQGRLVSNLYDGRQPAGNRELPWNGRSADGAPVPSGIYFIRLQVDGRTQTGKLVLTR
jgi:hypothetical protein